MTLATAESCTGGLVGAQLTAIAGSSSYYLGGVVSYANEAKVELLGVDPATLQRWGAVSAETATAMAGGIRQRLGADLAVAVTGIAGPGGGVPGKPVGLVYIAVASHDTVIVRRHLFAGRRDLVRVAAAQAALRAVIEAMGQGAPQRCSLPD
jgi:PncC family amidohydrolase